MLSVPLLQTSWTNKRSFGNLKSAWSRCLPQRCFHRYQPVHASYLCSRGVAQGSPRSGGIFVTCSHLENRWAASQLQGRGHQYHLVRDQQFILHWIRVFNWLEGSVIYRWIGACYQSFESISIYTCIRTYIYMCVCVIMCNYMYNYRWYA